jgi:hypothetical protein
VGLLAIVIGIQVAAWLLDKAIDVASRVKKTRRVVRAGLPVSRMASSAERHVGTGTKPLVLYICVDGDLTLRKLSGRKLA